MTSSWLCYRCDARQERFPYDATHRPFCAEHFRLKACVADTRTGEHWWECTSLGDDPLQIGCIEQFQVQVVAPEVVMVAEDYVSDGTSDGPWHEYEGMGDLFAAQRDGTDTEIEESEAMGNIVLVGDSVAMGSCEFEDETDFEMDVLESISEGQYGVQEDTFQMVRQLRRISSYD